MEVARLAAKMHKNDPDTYEVFKLLCKRIVWDFEEGREAKVFLRDVSFSISFE
jgi:hypothetical protein